MTDREKLIELLGKDVCKHDSCRDCEHNIDQDTCITYLKSSIADLILANGVTFVKDTNVPSWIPASEPPKEWRDKNGDAINYLIFTPDVGVDIGYWIEPMHTWFCLGVAFKVTHWMPLPEPPKEDAHD